MIYIRNVKTPIYGSDSAHYKFSTWFHREALLAGRWTEVANNADAAWASNYSSSYSDLYVDASQQGKVFRAAGFSTPPTNSALTLMDPLNDSNCFIANIIGYDTKTLFINMTSIARPMVSATGLVGKVHVFGQTNLLTAGAWTVLAAPGTEADRFQIRLEVGTTANRPWIYAYPKGDYSTFKSMTGGFTWAYGITERRSLINADIDGENFMLFDWNGYTSTAINGPYIWCGGRLTDTPIEDVYPYFIATNSNTSWVGTIPGWDWFQWQVYMLDQFSKPVAAYIEGPKYMSDLTYTSGIWHIDRWFNSYGRTARQYPFVVVDDVQNGGYKRGRFPWRTVHEQWGDWLIADAQGEHRTAPGKLLVDSAGITGCDIYPPLMIF